MSGFNLPDIGGRRLNTEATSCPLRRPRRRDRSGANPIQSTRPGSVGHARPGSFLDVFFFSIETVATGSGEMYTATLYGHLIASTEIGLQNVFASAALKDQFLKELSFRTER